MIRGHKILLEYEGLHLICFQCGRYGHKSSQCAEIMEKEKAKEQRPMQHQVSLGTQVVSSGIQVGQDKKVEELQPVKPIEEPKFGPWMVTTPRKPRKPSNSQKSQPGNSGDKISSGASTPKDQRGGFKICFFVQ